MADVKKHCQRHHRKDTDRLHDDLGVLWGLTRLDDRKAKIWPRMRTTCTPRWWGHSSRTTSGSLGRPGFWSHQDGMPAPQDASSSPLHRVVRTQLPMTPDLGCQAKDVGEQQAQAVRRPVIQDRITALGQGQAASFKSSQCHSHPPHTVHL